MFGSTKPKLPQGVDEGMVARASDAIEHSLFVEPANTLHDVAAFALTAALGDTHVVVPLTPTKAMIETGCENNPTQWNDGTDDGFAADVANDIYRAMISASQNTGGQNERT